MASHFPGEQSVPGAGSFSQDHAPDVSGGRGRHDQAGRHERGRAAEEPAAATQTGTHLCEAQQNRNEK